MRRSKNFNELQKGDKIYRIKKGSKDLPIKIEEFIFVEMRDSFGKVSVIVVKNKEHIDNMDHYYYIQSSRLALGNISIEERDGTVYYTSIQTAHNCRTWKRRKFIAESVEDIKKAVRKTIKLGYDPDNISKILIGIARDLDKKKAFKDGYKKYRDAFTKILPK